MVVSIDNGLIAGNFRIKAETSDKIQEESFSIRKTRKKNEVSLSRGQERDVSLTGKP
jgi:hypothetical protein